MLDNLSLTFLLQAIIAGLLLGLIYTAVAMGLSLTMGIMRVINVAHGAIVMLGAFVALTLFRRFGWNPAFSLLLIFPAFLIAGGLIDRALMRRVVRESETTGLLILFGVSAIVENGSILIWTTDTHVLTLSWTGTSIMLGDIPVSVSRLITGAITIVIVGLIHYFIQYTLTGKSIRAMAQNRDATLMLGIDANRLSMLAFGIGIASAAAGGVMLSMLFPFGAVEQINWLSRSFLIVIIGGPGNIRNTAIAAIFIGLVEALAPLAIPFQYIGPLLYGILAITLMVRGRGLAASESREI